MFESGCGLVCGEVLDIQESQGRASATSRQDRVVECSRLELGTDYDGYYHEATMECTWDIFDLDHRGSIDQECVVHPYLGEHFSWGS